MTHRIFKEVAQIAGACTEYFLQFFQEAPSELLDECNIVEIKKGVRFVTADDKLDKIRMLLVGSVKGLEEYVSGDTYAFKRFTPPEIFGEMEVLANLSVYRASLRAETDCIVVTFPPKLYKKYLQEHPEIFSSRVESILRFILSQEKDNRIYLMLNAMDRIKLYFIQEYNLHEMNNVAIIKKTRQEIADEIGYSEKTVNRVIKKLSEDNSINIVGKKLIVSETQYQRFLESVDDIV